VSTVKAIPATPKTRTANDRTAFTAGQRLANRAASSKPYTPPARIGTIQTAADVAGFTPMSLYSQPPNLAAPETTAKRSNHVKTPLLRPILIVVAILNYITTYGEFALARVLLENTEQFTLMVGLQIFTQAQFQQRWGVFAAGALIGALPIMIIYLALQDQIVGGLTQGAVKG